MKSHYDLLGLDPGADFESIKRAFRREIARYHPDKVSHLGPEFQTIASTKAAELTTAYTTLSNPSLRAAYDAGIVAEHFPPKPETPREAAPPRPTPPSPPPADGPARRPAAAGDDRGDIVRRAALGRLRTALAAAVTDASFVSVPGFDLACVSKAKSSLFRRATPPSVLVRLAAVVDRDVVVAAYAHAAKARIDQKPIVLLLAGSRLAPIGELAQAIEEHRRRNPALVDTLLPVPVEIGDWSAKIPANAPPSVRTLIDALKGFAG